MIQRNCRSLIILGFILTALLITSSTTAGFLLGTSRVFPIARDAVDFTVGDLDGDGIPDMGAVTEWTRILQVRFGLGDGAFGEETRYDLDGDGQLIRCGDMDNDGDNDLVLFTTGDNEYTDNFITVHVNDGSGQFSTGFQLNMPTEEYEIGDGLLADLNQDSNLDLALIHTRDDKIIVFIGAGNGTLAEDARYRPGVDLYSMICPDLDADGNLDLVLAGSGDMYEQGSVQVLYGLGDGTFEPAVQYLTMQGLKQVDAGDVDGDGDLDIAAAGDSEGDGALSVFLSRGDRTFQDPLYYSETFSHAMGVILEDRTGDGVLDAILWGSREWDENDIYILPGRGDGTFDESIPCMLSSYIGRAVLVDLDGNGGTDFVGMEEYSSYVTPVVVLMSRGRGGFVSPWRSTLDEEWERHPYKITSSDFNNDGFPDLAFGTSTLSAYTLIGNGDGSYQTAVSHPLPGSCGGVEIADVDRDGNMDLVVSCTYDQVSHLCIYPGNGDGTFGEIDVTELSQTAYLLDAAHLDGDNFIDLMMSTTEGCRVFHGDGTGGFTPGTAIPFALGPIGIDLGDIDGDGDLDLVLVFVYPDSMLTALNNGSGVFSDNGSLAVGLHPRDVTLGDFNGDGDLDLATANQTNLDGTLYFGNGDGSFTAGPDFVFGANPYDLDAADMDGDGLDDLAIGIYPEWEESNALCLLRSSGSGFPGPPERYGAGDEPYFVHLFDADSDGDLDLAVSDYARENNIWVLLNSSGGSFIATGPGRAETNPSEVRTFDPLTGGLRHHWPAYGVSRWGVNVALGQLTGSGQPEVVTGAGPGAVFGPHVRGFSSSGAPLPGVSYLAYGTNKWGVNVSCGDIDGDGYDEIVTGAGPGAVFGPHVRGWNWDGGGTPTPIPGISYFAYGTPKYGVNVSCGDIDGDGFDEIVTGAGLPGPGARVQLRRADAHCPGRGRLHRLRGRGQPLRSQDCGRPAVTINRSAPRRLCSGSQHVSIKIRNIDIFC